MGSNHAKCFLLLACFVPESIRTLLCLLMQGNLMPPLVCAVCPSSGDGDGICPTCGCAPLPHATHRLCPQ